MVVNLGTLSLQHLMTNNCYEFNSKHLRQRQIPNPQQVHNYIWFLNCLSFNCISTNQNVDEHSIRVQITYVPLLLLDFVYVLTIHSTRCCLGNITALRGLWRAMKNCSYSQNPKSQYARTFVYNADNSMNAVIGGLFWVLWHWSDLISIFYSASTKSQPAS